MNTKVFFISYKKILKAIYIAFFFTIAFTNSYESQLKKCLWVKSDEMSTDDKIENLISNAYRSGYKIIFLQVNIHEDSRYNPFINEHIESNFDSLKSAIFWANWYDLEIHLWLNVYKIWSSTWTPPENHVYYKLNDSHKDWFATDINGHIDCDINFNSFDSRVLDSDGFQGVFLSPLNPNVNNYILTIIEHLIHRYSGISGNPDFSGIHLDYFRYKDSMYGYNYIGRKSFYDENQFDPIYINRILNEDLLDSANNLLDKWTNFKNSKINKLLFDIKTITNNYDNLKLSVAVKPNIYESKIRWNQNWDEWIFDDYIDFIVVMNYYNDTESFSNNLWEIYKYFDDRKNINKIYIGINAIDVKLEQNQLRNSKLIKNQIDNVIEFSFPGISIFSSEYFNYNPSLYLEIFTD